MEYLPNVESVSVVPVGLSKYRDGLYPLEPFNAQDAGEVIDLIEKYQKICMEKYGIKRQLNGIIARIRLYHIISFLKCFWIAFTFSSSTHSRFIFTAKSMPSL